MQASTSGSSWAPARGSPATWQPQPCSPLGSQLGMAAAPPLGRICSRHHSSQACSTSYDKVNRTSWQLAACSMRRAHAGQVLAACKSSSPDSRSSSSQGGNIARHQTCCRRRIVRMAANEDADSRSMTPDASESTNAASASGSEPQLDSSGVGPTGSNSSNAGGGSGDSGNGGTGHSGRRTADGGERPEQPTWFKVWMWATAVVYLVWRWHWRRERHSKAQLAQQEEEQQAQYDDEWERFAEGYGRGPPCSNGVAGSASGRG